MRNRKRLALGLATVVGVWASTLFSPPLAQDDSVPPSTDRKVMDPEQFFGDSKVGYLAAQQCPEVIAKLLCYCGCDTTDKHTSLLDCFASDHGADCKICTDEALMALTLKKQDKSIAQIQQAVDTKFTKEYPFEKPSKALLDYRAHRLYKASAKADAITPSATPKLKPGKAIGNCCGNKKNTGKDSSS
jgi:Protein of unknown function with PCYCGC motif